MKIFNAKDFGKAVKITRKKQKLTQIELAAASGTGIRFIGDLEQGKPSCQLDKSLMVSRMLGIKLEALLPPSIEEQD